MISLSDLKSHSALPLLEKYNGKNPYLKKLRNEYIINKKIRLTETQTSYILENHDKEPIFLNRVIAITPYLGEELQKKYSLTFVPEKILIEYLLADTEKTFHVYGKLKKNQTESGLYFIPKTQVIDDLYFEEVKIEVDFEKYDKLCLEKRGWKTLPFQHGGVKFLLARNGAILGDDMGVTKTLQSIIAALEKGAKKILIVCPSAVKINWEREINIFCNDTTIIEGKEWKEAKFTIINYDILKNFHTLNENIEENVTPNRELINANFDLIIIDEAHYLADPKSQRGAIMVDLCVKNKIPTVWLLSGTAVTNYPKNYYNLLKLIRCPVADNWKHYMTRYCDARKFFKTLKNGKRKQIWIMNGASNLDELVARTKNYFLRRLKTDVLDMPEKTITNVYHKLSEKGLKDYDNLWEEYLKERKRLKKRGSIEKDLVESILLRKFIAMQAIPHTIEMAKNAIEQGEKVVIFTTFKDELQEIAEALGDICVIHNGTMNAKEKQVSLDAFQTNSKIRAIVGNDKSLGTGTNCTAGNVTVFNSFSWVPGTNEQCEDRTWRMGQKNNCKIYYQLFLNTISIKMLETLKLKTDIIGKITGGKEEREVTELIMDIVLEEQN